MLSMSLQWSCVDSYFFQVVNVQVWTCWTGETLRRFPNKWILKRWTTALALRPPHQPSINQFFSTWMQTESTCTHKSTHQGNVEICWMNDMSFIIQYIEKKNSKKQAERWRSEHDTLQTTFKGRRQWIPNHNTKPFCPSFLFILSSLNACRMSEEILLRICEPKATGASIKERMVSGVWRWWGTQ